MGSGKWEVGSGKWEVEVGSGKSDRLQNSLSFSRVGSRKSETVSEIKYRERMLALQNKQNTRKIILPFEYHPACA